VAHGPEYRWFKATLLGDDLYWDQQFCEMVLQAGMSFLCTCKPDSLPWLTETVEDSYGEEKSVRKWTGRSHQAVDKRGSAEGQPGCPADKLLVFPDTE
jgi:hypothetical protein